MEIIFPVIILVMMMLVVALLLPYGLWGNAVNLINVVTAALLATNFWEPASNWITSKMPSMMFLTDIFVLWILFGAFLFGMRTATDLLSKIKLKFPPLVERVGNVFFAVWVGWVLVCFLSMSLHMAPLARQFAFGGFKPETGSFFGLYPDRMWLGFVQRMSMGPFYRGDKNKFDPQGEFLFRYAERRAQFERQSGLTAKAQ
jgi:uncharacterized membrane protein required for colicin V production